MNLPKLHLMLQEILFQKFLTEEITLNVKKGLTMRFFETTIRSALSGIALY